MVFCAKCGVEVPDGAAFCPKCGTQVGVSIKSEKQDYSGIGGILLLVGGIWAILSSIFPLAFMPFIRGILSRMTYVTGVPFMPFAIWNWITEFMFVAAIVAIVLGVFTLYAYTRVRAGDVKTGGTIAIIAGVLLFLSTGGIISGLITLVGGILCYTSK